MNGRIDKKTFDWMVDFRRDLHQFPELSWEEEKTATKIENQLNEWRIDNQRMSGTGIVADIPGPTGVQKVALRSDIDALPIAEETGLPFASQRSGIMHACGHDGHASMLLGAAKILSQEKDLPAPIRLIFQPAEERGSGARALIEDGVLDQVSMIFGAHLDRNFDTGKIVVTSGPVNASIDAFKVEILGPEGHAGRPNETVDAIVVGSHIVIALQAVVSRETHPGQPVVLTVGKFRAGTSRNAIAGSATLEGTMRSHDPEVRDHIEKAIKRVAESIAQSFQAKVKITFKHGPPSLSNDLRLTKISRAAAIEVVGEDNILEMSVANMAAEDFSYYAREIPACYVRFGASFEDRKNFPSHTSRFDFNEKAMAFGAAWMCEVAIKAGRELEKRRGEVAVV